MVSPTGGPIGQEANLGMFNNINQRQPHGMGKYANQTNSRKSPLGMRDKSKDKSQSALNVRKKASINKNAYLTNTK
jgi:hypothetical protein